jgi:hypothetical protein
MVDLCDIKGFEAARILTSRGCMPCTKLNHAQKLPNLMLSLLFPVTGPAELFLVNNQVSQLDCSSRVWTREIHGKEVTKWGTFQNPKP